MTKKKTELPEEAIISIPVHFFLIVSFFLSALPDG
jgi:hypothetical protein